MGSFSLKAKVLIFSILVSVLLVLAGSVGIYSLRSVTKSYERIASEFQEYKKTLTSLHFESRQLVALVALAGAQGINSDLLTTYKGKYDEVSFVFDSTVNLIQNNLKTDQDKSDYEVLSGSWQKMNAAATEVFTLALSQKKEDQEKLAKALHEDLFPSGKIVEEMVAGLADRVVQLEDAEFKQMGATADLGTILGGVFAISGLIITMAFGYFFSRSLSSSLAKSIFALTQVAQELAGANEQVLKSSESLSSSTREQEVSLEQTAASVQEMKATVSGNTQNAEKSRDVSSKSFGAANNGKKTVNEVLFAIDEISSSNQKIVESLNITTGEIYEFVKMVNEISQKTKIINSIVFQTKLLSFNASVEAAQAGEHGRGFSVVAQEIGNLAKMSGGASVEINKILNASTTKAKSMADGMKEKVDQIILKGTEKIEQGMLVAKKCDEALTEIVQNSTEVQAMAGEIASSSREQESGINMLETVVLQLKQTATQNAANSEETANASQSLHSQVAQINSMIDELTCVISGASKKLGPKKTDSSQEQKPEDESASKSKVA